jgi:hypothetical protein
METEVISHAYRLLPYIFAEDDIIEIRTLGAMRVQKWTNLKDAPDIIADLTKLGGSATDMYFGANPRANKKGGTAKDVSMARCLYADFDGGTTIEQAKMRILESLIPQPTAIVATGGGVHAWWRLSEPCLDMDIHCAHQKALAARLGSDKCIHDAPRLMRLPGFVNTKYDHRPLCYVAAVDTDNTYSLADFPDPTDEKSERVSVVVPPVPKSMSNLSHRFLNEGYVMPAGRRQTIFTVACDLAARSWDEGDAIKAITERAQSLGLSPMDERDIPRQISNAFKETRLPCVGEAETATPAAADSALVITPICELSAAHKDLRKPIIHGLLRYGETMNIISAPKMGKSWMVNALAIKASLGQEWLGFQCAKTRVLLIDNELHGETTARRIPALCDAMGINIDQLKDLDTLNLRGNLIDFSKLGPVLFDKIEKGRYGIVILDAFYRFLVAGMAENDNGAMAGVYNMIDQWAEKLGCCFIMIHHTSKGNQSDKDVTDVGSGAGSMSRAADTHLILRHHEDEHHLVLDAAVRSFAPVEPKVLHWQFPIFSCAGEDKDAKRLKRKGQTDDGWTPERFVDEVWGDKTLTSHQALAIALGYKLSANRVKTLRQAAMGAGLLNAETLRGPYKKVTICNPITLSEGLSIAPSNVSPSNDAGAVKSGGAVLTGTAPPLNTDIALGHLQNIGGGVSPSNVLT